MKRAPKMFYGFVACVAIWLSVSANAQNAQPIEWYRGSSTIALVFLHGLGGCAVPNGKTANTSCPPGMTDSFRSDTTGKTWPSIVHDDDYQLARGDIRHTLTQPLRLSDLGVWGVDYSQLTGSGCPNFSIPNVAAAVRRNLETSEIFHRYEQIIFMGHSMGGLIIKDMMLSWQGTDNRSVSYLPRVIGALLLGVPSKGSPVASDPATARYLAQILLGPKLAGVCGRQTRDLFAGRDNTYLDELETKWIDVITTRRNLSRSDAPRVGCAYETEPEPIVGGYGPVVVPQIYTSTLCDLGSDAIGVSHTQLPKPPDKTAAVHQSWLRRDLDKIFASWSEWPFVRIAFPPGKDTLVELADKVNSGQDSFRLAIAEPVKAFAPKADSYEGPNYFAVVSKVVLDNTALCMEANWMATGPAEVSIKPAGSCRN